MMPTCFTAVARRVLAWPASTCIVRYEKTAGKTMFLTWLQKECPRTLRGACLLQFKATKRRGSKSRFGAGCVFVMHYIDCTQRGSISQWSPLFSSQWRPLCQKCTSKGIWRQGIVLKHRNSFQKNLCPVAICPTYVALSFHPTSKALVFVGGRPSRSQQAMLQAMLYCFIDLFG